MKRILIMAAGTGGHIFPGLAVGRALKEAGVDVCWLGTIHGMENQLIPNVFPFYPITIKSIRKRRLLGRLLAIALLIHATMQVYRIIRKLQPNLILGMGGYVCGPGGVVARLLNIPLIIHEQNAIAGRTNQLLSNIAHTVLEAFPNTFSAHAHANTTGNPVLPTFYQAPPPCTRFREHNGPLRVLVLGGSQGARSINEAVLEAACHYEKQDDIVIWHQTGKLDYEFVQTAYQKRNVSAKVSAFIDDILSAYCWADIAICRAGALTVTELAAVGLASILIPYPHAVDNHQLYNARFLEQVGGSIILLSNLLNKQTLIQLLDQFIHDRDRLLMMATCAQKQAKPEALSLVINECEKYL